MPEDDRLYHYTNLHGLRGILTDNALNASTIKNHPADARHGDGKGFIDIPPGVMTHAQLSRRLVRHPFSGARFTHYLFVDLKGLDVREVRNHVYLLPGIEPLDLTERIVDHGFWELPRPASS
jgi:hypothetical protein